MPRLLRRTLRQQTFLHFLGHDTAAARADGLCATGRYGNDNPNQPPKTPREDGEEQVQ
jgi:hypothetical protein